AGGAQNLSLRCLALTPLGSGALLRFWEGNVVAGLLAAVAISHGCACTPHRRQPPRCFRVVRARRLPEFGLHFEDLDRRPQLAELTWNLKPSAGTAGHETHEFEVPTPDALERRLIPFLHHVEATEVGLRQVTQGVSLGIETLASTHTR